jgi:hypothetical protein
LKANYKEGKKYNSFNKDHGPPHWRISARYDPIEKNEYLLSKGVDIEALVEKQGHRKNLLDGAETDVTTTS